MLLVILNLAAVETGIITTVIIAVLLILGALMWIWQKKFPKPIIKNIILILFGPLVVIALGGFFIQTITILNPADALLIILIIVVLFWLIPKLLK